MGELDIIELLLEAAQYDITGIMIQYDGDKHPYIDTICFSKLPFKSAEEIADEIDPWGNKDLLYDPKDDNQLYKKLETYFDEKLGDLIEGDWYDEGGYGVVTIMVPSGEIHIASTVRVMRTENFIYKRDMISGKTKNI
jgi:hypothetical protein